MDKFVHGSCRTANIAEKAKRALEKWSILFILTVT